MLHFEWFEIRTDIFVLILSIIWLLSQVFLCFKVKKKWIRLMLVYFLFVLIVLFIALSLIFDGWDRVGFLILAIGCVVFLFACGIGWLIWWMVSRNRKVN